MYVCVCDNEGGKHPFTMLGGRDDHQWQLAGKGGGRCHGHECGRGVGGRHGCWGGKERGLAVDGFRQSTFPKPRKSGNLGSLTHGIRGTSVPRTQRPLWVIANTPAGLSAADGRHQPLLGHQCSPNRAAIIGDHQCPLARH